MQSVPDGYVLMLRGPQLGSPGSCRMHPAQTHRAMASGPAWMTKVLPAILPRCSRRSSSRVASMTPRPVAYSRPKLPCRSSGLPARCHALCQILLLHQACCAGSCFHRARTCTKRADAGQKTHLLHRKARSLCTCCTHQTTCRPALSDITCANSTHDCMVLSGAALCTTKRALSPL